MNQNPSIENVLAYKKQINICMSLQRKSLKKHLKSITAEKGINTTNKSFWKFIKPFLINKGSIGSNDITLVEKNVVTIDEKTLASTFNKHYINIVDGVRKIPPVESPPVNSPMVNSHWVNSHPVNASPAKYIFVGI